MKVSIITPCYNAAPYIKKTIASVQHQSLTDWEMIVVDDGSTDNSVDIVRKIANEDSRIKVVQKENGGTASARNYGLRLAQGEYIQLLDADDTIAPEKLLRQVEMMDSNHIDISYTDYQVTTGDNTFTGSLKGFTINLPRLLMGWGVFGTIPIHTFMYRTAFLVSNGITFSSEIREREDWDFHIRILMHNPKKQRIKGFCGAYYFRCPTGKTTCGSLSKLQIGTFRFLIYKIRHTDYWMRLLLILRLSIGLIEVTMLTARHRMSITEDILPLFAHSYNNALIFIIALLLLPISSLLFIIRTIWVLTHK